MDILNNLKGDDTIYHYTTMEKALHYILGEGYLKFSQRKNMTDPVESSKIFPVTDVKEEHADVQFNQLRNEITNRSKKTKHISFCMNDNTHESSVEYEYFGCAKPRMWDVYADNYKGVCLAFSKRELLKNIEDPKENKIHYKKYNKLSQKSRQYSLTYERYKTLGYEAYKKELLEKIDADLFWKHCDYVGETEYRIMSFTDSKDYIKIAGTLKAIIISSDHKHTSSFAQKSLKEYAQQYNADLLYANWSDTSVSFLTPSLGSEYIERAKNLLKS